MGAIGAFCADWGDAALRGQVAAALVDSGELVALAGAAIGAWAQRRSGEPPKELLLTAACELLVNALKACDEGVAQAIEADIMRKLHDAIEACPASLLLFSAAVRCSALLGADVEEQFAGNSMLHDVQW